MNPREPKARGDLFDPPPGFSEAECAAWAYAIAQAPRGLLKRIDRAVLAIWCVAEATYHKARAQQATLDAQASLPMLVRTPNGAIQQSPYFGIMNRQAAILLRASSELGFSPSARTRIAADIVPGADELQDDYGL